MRILHLIHDNPFEVTGGAQAYAASLAGEQARLGHDVGLFFLDARGRKSERLIQYRRDGLSLFVGNLDRMQGLATGFQFRNSYDNHDSLDLFKRVMAAFKPELVHIHSLILLSYRMPGLAKSAGASVLWTLHDYWPLCHRIVLMDHELDQCHGAFERGRCSYCGKERYNHWPLIMLQPMLAAAFRSRNRRLLGALCQADALLAPSKYLEGVYRKNGVPQELLRPHVYGIGKLPRLYARQEDGPLRFGFLGNPARHKGAVPLAACFSDRPDATLTYYGPVPRGPDLVNIYSSASEEAIRVHGPYRHEDVDKVLRSIDVLVLPSLWQENSPVVIHEALAAGIPVLAFDVGGVPELVRPGVNGWLMPAGDFPAMRGKIRELARDPAEVDRMSLGAAQVRDIGDDAEACVKMAMERRRG